MTFQQKLDRIAQKNNSLACIGLDSDYDKIPAHLKNPPSPRLRRTSKKYPVFEFNKKIIDATYDLVCSYKPNSAFYEARGVNGVKQLKLTCDYLRKKHPEIPIILDAKRGDIGSTNLGYIDYAFNYLKADAITLHPYLGGEALSPFLELKDKGFFILCKTSNPGSDEFQNLYLHNDRSGDKNYLYQYVADRVSKEWNIYGNCMLVVGATYPEELAKIRKIVGDMTLLIPGAGTQGGDVEKTVKAGLDSKGTGIIVNSARAIIFSSNKKDFARRAREETLKLRYEINRCRSLKLKFRN